MRYTVWLAYKKSGWVIQSKCNKVFFCSENQNKACSLHHCLELPLKNHMPLWDRTVIIVLILYSPILWLNNSANGIPDFLFLLVSPSLLYIPPMYFCSPPDQPWGCRLYKWSNRAIIGLFNLDTLIRSPPGQTIARASFNLCQLTCQIFTLTWGLLMVLLTSYFYY